MSVFTAEVKEFVKIFVGEQKGEEYHEYLFQIPDFQRPYSWDGEKNCVPLLNDLLEAFTSRGTKNEPYFCGSLVLFFNKRDGRFDVIDGQQRLITFTIILAVIKDYYKGRLNDESIKRIEEAMSRRNGRKIQIKDKSEQAHFNRHILRDRGFDNPEEAEDDSKYLENAYSIKNFLADPENNYAELKIDDFIKWLFDEVRFVVVEATDFDCGIKIFDILNTTGVPLTSAQILKSRMMGRLDEDDWEDFKVHWESISNCADENGVDSDKSLNEILNYYTYYYIGGNPKKRYDAELLSRFGNEKENKKTMLDEIYEIDKFAKAYSEVMSKKNEYIYMLKYLGWHYWKPILTTAYHVNYRSFKKLTEVLVAFYYQNWLAGYTEPKIKQISFKILKEVKKGEISIGDIKKLCKEHLIQNNTTQTYKEKLSSTDAGKKPWIKAILCLLEYSKLENAKERFIEHNNMLQLEHVLPQKPKRRSEWEQRFDRSGTPHELYVNKLGNLTLLSMQKNNECKNYDFERKKEIYKNGNVGKVASYQISRDIAKKRGWGPNDIEKRQKDLGESIAEILDIF